MSERSAWEAQVDALLAEHEQRVARLEARIGALAQPIAEDAAEAPARQAPRRIPHGRRTARGRRGPRGVPRDPRAGGLPPGT